MAWLLESGLSRHNAEFGARRLRAVGVAAQAVPGNPHWAIEVENVDGTLRAWFDQVLHIRGIVEEAARRERQPMSPYKPFEAAGILEALARTQSADGETPAQRGLRLWHELVWAQAFPNGNHRTALLVVAAMMRRGEDLLAHEDELALLFQASKRLVTEREFVPDEARVKAEHWNLTQSRLGPLLGV